MELEHLQCMCEELEHIQRIVHKDRTCSSPDYFGLTLPPALEPVFPPPSVPMWQSASRLRAPPPVAQPEQHLLPAPGSVLLSRQLEMMQPPLPGEFSTRLPAPPRRFYSDHEMPVNPPSPKKSSRRLWSPHRTASAGVDRSSTRPTTTASADVTVTSTSTDDSPPQKKSSRKLRSPRRTLTTIHPSSIQPTTTASTNVTVTSTSTDDNAADVNTATDVTVSQAPASLPVSHDVVSGMEIDEDSAADLQLPTQLTTTTSTDDTAAGVNSVPDVTDSQLYVPQLKSSRLLTTSDINLYCCSLIVTIHTHLTASFPRTALVSCKLATGRLKQCTLILMKQDMMGWQ